MYVKKKAHAVFLDADGTLWDDIGPGGILSGADQASRNLVMFSELQNKQYFKIIISNQTLAARKQISYFRYRHFINKFLKNLIRQRLITDFAICYHHPKAKNIFLRKKCDCRKPSPGLINIMIKKYNINPLSSFFIGDRITDIQAGAAAKIKNLLLLVNDKMLEGNENLSAEPVLNLFFPLRDLKEFCQFEEIQNEN